MPSTPWSIKISRFFQRYDVTLELAGQDEKAFLMKHTFIVGDSIVAEGTSRRVLIGKNGALPPVQVLEVVKRLGYLEST